MEVGRWVGLSHLPAPIFQLLHLGSGQDRLLAGAQPAGQGSQRRLVDDFMREQILGYSFEGVAMLLEELAGPLVHLLDGGLGLVVNALCRGFAISRCWLVTLQA